MIIWSSRQLSQLAELSTEERFQRIAQAKLKYTPAEKLLLSVCKLLLLIPPFIVAARLGNAYSLLVLLALAIGYPLVMRPLSLTLLQKHL